MRRAKKYIYKIKESLDVCSENGHTFAELSLVVAIISIISAVSIVNYSSRKAEEALSIDAFKISQIMRRAQNLALSPKGGGLTSGFGVYVDTDTKLIKIFSDTSLNGVYNAGEDIAGENILLSNEVKILGLRDSASASLLYSQVIYQPPDPTVNINNNPSVVDMTITIALEKNNSRTKAIKVNNVGLIELQ